MHTGRLVPEETSVVISSPRKHSLRWQRLLGAVLDRLDAPPLRVLLWNGEEIRTGQAPIATVRIHDRRTLVKLLLDPELEFGEAYARGSLSIDGDLLALLEATAERSEMKPSLRSRLSAALGFYDRSIGAARSGQNARHHYELGEEFYRAWLDESMTYSCAFAERPEVTLEQAQAAKMSLICDKLELTPGQEVIEAGSGWGALALYMAEHRGVRVRAYNVSTEQVAFARARARARGLDDRVTFFEEDYRCIAGRCDAFVCVGMLEHVGRANYARFGGVVARCLAPGGRGLLHFIGRSKPLAMNRWIRRRIFPGGHAPALSEALRALEPNGLTVVGIENLRPHYAWTLERWLERYERASPTLVERFGETLVRTWRLYLSSAAASYRSGWLELYQIVFTHARAGAFPRVNRPSWSPGAQSTARRSLQ